MKFALQKVLLACVLITPLTACQTMQDSIGIMGIGGDNKYDISYLKSNLKVGTTTSEQVISLLGKPDARHDGATGPTYFRYVEGKTQSNELLNSAMSSIGLGGVANTGKALSEGKQRSIHIGFSNNKVSDFSVNE